MPPSANPAHFAVSIGNSSLLLRAADELQLLSCVPISVYRQMPKEQQAVFQEKADFINRIFDESLRVDWVGLA